MLDTILAFTRAIFEELDPKTFQRRFLEALLAAQNVERGSLWVRREGVIECIEAAGEQSEAVLGLTIPADRPSVVGWVMDNARMTVAEPAKDPRHFKEAELTLASKSTLILCYPLLLSDGSVFGAVELIDTTAQGSRLNLRKDYLEILEHLVAVGSIALGQSLALEVKERQCRTLKSALERFKGQPPIVGGSEAVRGAMKKVRAYARTDFPVLITGESGTGKELFAQAIHQASARRDGPFLAQNCSAIPETLLESELFGYRKGAFTGADRDKTGLFESAHGGTVFLDEIGDMAPSLQAKILRLAQNGELRPLGGRTTRTVDVRLIAATNKDLAKAIEAGEFREDLFYRLNVLPLELPPLRQRPEDIPELLDYFLKRDCARLGIPARRLSAQARGLLRLYSWRGNIREMENMVKYLLTVSEADTVEAHDLPTRVLAEAAPEAGREGPPREALACRSGGAGSAKEAGHGGGLAGRGLHDPREALPGGTGGARGGGLAAGDDWGDGSGTQSGLAGDVHGSHLGQGAGRDGSGRESGLAGYETASEPTPGSEPPPQSAQPPLPRAGGGLSAMTWEELERAYVLELLEANRWSVTRAARQAGVNRSTFDSRLRKLKVSRG